MITFKSFLKEEVFNWYIIKGNTQKGKVSHVGTERQLKLKIRKPIYPSGHVLMKSRKRLTIGDMWKGSYMPEEVKIDEGALYDKKDGTQKKWMDELEKGIKTAVVQIGKSAIGGDSIMIRISLDPEKDWNNKIYQNSRYSQFHLDRDCSLVQFSKRHNLSKFRKTKVKTAKAAVDKINTWIKNVEATPYKP